MSDQNDPGPKSPKGTQSKTRLNIKVADDVAKGAYANLPIIHNSDMEFVLDFLFVEPQRPQAQVVSRVVTNPRTAKRLHMALTELLKRFEERVGPIAIPEQTPPKGTYH